MVRSGGDTLWGSMRLICLGLGYTARAFVRRHGGRFSTIGATARDPDSALNFNNLPVDVIPLWDGDAALRRAAGEADVILVSAGPDASGDPFADRLRACLTTPGRGKHVLYLSTVGVYGDHGGAWVDEATPPRPASDRSRWRLDAEGKWLALAKPPDLAVQIFRLAGIYGPGRSAVDNLRSGTARRVVKPGQVFNRIHVDDIADVLMRALERGRSGAVWNVADNEPAPPQDVVAFAARCLGIEPPPEVSFETAGLSPMARSFYGENKRISNAALREKLGVRLNYPTYREGIAAIAGSPPP